MRHQWDKQQQLIAKHWYYNAETTLRACRTHKGLDKSHLLNITHIVHMQALSHSFGLNKHVMSFCFTGSWTSMCPVSLTISPFNIILQWEGGWEEKRNTIEPASLPFTSTLPAKNPKFILPLKSIHPSIHAFCLQSLHHLQLLDGAQCTSILLCVQS